VRRVFDFSLIIVYDHQSKEICKRCDSSLLCKFVSFSLEYNPVHLTTSCASELCIFDPILIELEERKNCLFKTY
jgi:hypothetical protein